ncbi:MAG: TRM11 family SAM-dependent methyltransferase [Christensenellales bacterium]|jgi:DNA modification methylase
MSFQREPEDFNLELNTVWSFPDRGKWATHDAKYRGNWSPYIPRNIMLRYSQEKDLVLDQFAGGGTSIIEAKLLNRNIIGVDINPKAIEICKSKINFECDNNSIVNLHIGDACNLDFIQDESVDLICTHPPYADIIKYSEDIEGDLSLLNYKDYLEQMVYVAAECYRVLKKDKFCAILVGDTRKKGYVVPLGYKVMQLFTNAGFKLKEIIIKQQHNCKATGYWKSNSIKYNFLLLAHEYIYIFRK